jgi:hypothetical protein
VLTVRVVSTGGRYDAPIGSKDTDKHHHEQKKLSMGNPRSHIAVYLFVELEASFENRCELLTEKLETKIFEIIKELYTHMHGI